MDLTWSALLVLLLIVTPALCALATFRTLHPKIRYVHNSNLVSIIFPSLFSFLVNIPLIGFFIEKALKLKVLSCSSDDLNLIYEFIFSHHSFNPILRPALFVSNLFSNSSNDLDIVLFYLDIHLRVVFFSLLLSGTFLLVLALDDYFSSLAYLKRRELQKVGCFKKSLCKIFGYKLQNRNHLGWFSSLLKRISNGLLFHQWNQLIGDNTRTQTVFCDIFFDDDNMYTGMLDDWLPKDASDVSSFSLTCVLRYYPNTINSKGEEVRKWKFIVNNGTLILPFPKIKTINIWKLSINTALKIAVNNKNDLEKLKWHLAIWHHKKDIFKSVIITVDFEPMFKNANDFYEYLDNFLSDSNYDIPIEKIQANVVRAEDS